MRTRSTRSVLLLGVLSGAASLGACDALDPTSFDRDRETAEIVVEHNPGGGTGATGFGTVVYGFGTLLPDLATPARTVRASRFAASAGAGGPYSVFAAFDERVLDARSTTGLRVSAGPDARYNGCVAGLFCGIGSSVSFAATPVWHQDAATTRAGCVIVPSGNAIVDSRTGDHREQVQVRCEASSTQIQPINVPVERVEFGASATSLPAEHPLGAAIFGAPGDSSGTGSLYRLDDYPLNGFVRVDLPGTPVSAGLGRTLASVALADGTILLATGGQGRPNDPLVVVITLDASGTTVVRACLRGQGTQYGSALAFGNFDMDGTPDLVVGAGAWTNEIAATQHVDQPIALYSGSDLVSGHARGCEDPPSTPLAPARRIDCLADPGAGFACAATTNDTYTGFGASLAAGDVNGDHHDDLIIGAPLSGVRAAGAGVVVVLAGGTSFAALGATDHAILSYASVGTGAHLGASVSTVPGVDRFEIVAGAPGASHVALFFCSGIHGDRPEDFAGMSGVTHGCVIGPTAVPDVDAGRSPLDASPATDAALDAGPSRDAGVGDAAIPDADVDASTGDADVDAAANDANVDAA